MFTQKQLDVFRTVMSTGSVSEAARRINLSQPSVSRILAELERQFGASMFERKSKGLKPTPEAEAFLEEVERNYIVLTNLADAAAQIVRKERGRLSFATITSASLELVPRALKHLELTQKNISVSWQVKSSKWVIDFARSGALKTGFANVLRMPSGMRILYENAIPHMCFIPPDHPLAVDNGPLSMRDLRPYPVIGLLGEVADELALRNIGTNARFPMTVETSLSALTLSQSSGAIPIIDAFTAHYWENQHTGRARIIKNLPLYRFAVFEPLGSKASLIDQEFQQCLINEICQILKWLDTPRGGCPTDL